MAEEIKSSEYIEVDKNLVIETVFPDAEDAVLHSVREAPFDLYGYLPEESTPVFRRMPRAVSHAVSDKFNRLSKESVGIRIRFCTDSQYVLLKAVEAVVSRNSHMSLEMSAGFDLYEDTESDSHFVKAFMPPYKMEGGYEQIVRFPDRRLRYLTVHMPTHSQISDVYIGLQADAKLGGGRKYIGDKPIIVYGSSIVHGTGCSRPGMVYTNILCRHLNRNVVNLGFSGNAKAEEVVMNYIAGLDMCCFVYDYDHNAPNPDYLAQTHKRGYDIVRAAQPDLPIILITRPNVATNPNTAYERKQIIIDTYRAAIDSGDRNIHFIDGEDFFRGRWEGDCTIDGVHPTDLGYMLMADGIEAVIRRSLRGTVDSY